MTEKRSRLWAGALVLLAGGLFAWLIGVLHADQRRQLAQSGQVLQRLAQAHEALDAGFLHHALDEAGATWGRGGGRAQLEDALRTYRGVLAEPLPLPAPAAPAELAARVDEFERLLAADPVPEAALRRTLQALSAAAAEVDQQLRAELPMLAARLERRLQAALLLSGLGLAGLGLALHRTGRERDASQRRLAESEERFRQLVEQSGSGVVIVRRGRFDYINPRGAEIVGRAADELVGQGADSCMAPEERLRLRRHIERLLAAPRASGTSETFEVQRPDGTRVPVELQSALGRMGGATVIIGVFHDLSERLRAERAARASEANHQAMVSALDEGVLIFDARGRPLEGNPAAQRLLGVSLEQLAAAPRETLQWPVTDIDGRALMPNDMPLARVLASGEAVHDELLGYTRPDGSRIWLRTNAVPLFEDDGRALRGAVVSFSDITERKRVEDDLACHRRELEARVAERTAELERALAAQRQGDRFLQAVADHQPTLIAYTDRTLRLRFANRAYLRWHGLADSDGIGREIGSFLSADEVAAAGPLRERVLAGESISGPAQMRSHDGRCAHFWLHRIPWREGGEVVGYCFFATDITEVWLAEQRLEAANRALREAESRARLIADNVPGRVSYWDREGRCRFANRAYADWYGRRADELIGLTKAEILGPEHTALSASHVEAVLRGEPQSFEHGVPRPDGPPAQEWTQYMPDRRDGSVFGYFALAVDVTALRVSERRLLELNDALTLARDRALQASRAKSAFLANMSHEIRTPMNAIIGLTHLLQREIGDAPARERLAKVAAAAQHLLGLVNDVLDLSKIEAGKFSLDHAEFDPRELVERTVAMVSERAREKGLALALDLGELPARLASDPIRLSQALLNLLSNAVKFTEHGRIDVAVQASPRAGGDWLLRFSVADTGIGIPAAAQARLFDVFEQADASTTRRHGGSGLGLAITRSLAELMGGEVGLTSEPGAGSRFWFTAVAAAAGPGRPLPGPPVGSAEAVLARRHTGARVLLAEDNLVNQEVALDLLRAVDLQVDVAANGREALRMAQANAYALILMDMQMPELDGLQATRALRSLPAGREVPILAMTANAFHEDRQACLAAGMNDHIAKPVEPEQLYATLLRWLPGGSVGARPPVVPAPAGGEFDGIDGLHSEVALRLVGRRPDTLRHVLSRFARVYTPGQPALERLCAVHDAAEQQRSAHSLRGACASVGAWRAQQLAEALETLCRRGAGEAERQVAATQLRAEVVRLVAELQARLPALASAG